MKPRSFGRIEIGLLMLLFAAIALPARVAAAEDASSKKPDVLENLKFRNLGPAVAGGRVAAVVGIPSNSNVYYVGAAGGGGGCVAPPRPRGAGPARPPPRPPARPPPPPPGGPPPGPAPPRPGGTSAAPPLVGDNRGRGGPPRPGAPP